MTETVNAYIRTANAETLTRLIVANGHMRPLDPTDTDVLRGYVLAMVAQGSIVIEEDVNPITAITLSDYDEQIADALTRKEAAKTTATRNKYADIADALYKERADVPSVAVANKAERDQWANKYLEDRLSEWLDEDDRARSKLAAKILEGTSEALHAIEWLSGTVKTLKLARLASVAFAARDASADSIKPVTLREAAERVAANEQRSLDLDSYRGTSSAAFANAMQAEERAAAIDFIRLVRQGF